MSVRIKTVLFDMEQRVFSCGQTCLLRSHDQTNGDKVFPHEL